MSKARTRKTRRRTRQVMKHGVGAVRSHKRLGGRTGSIHAKSTKS